MIMIITVSLGFGLLLGQQAVYEFITMCVVTYKDIDANFWHDTHFYPD